MIIKLIEGVNADGSIKVTKKHICKESDESGMCNHSFKDKYEYNRHRNAHGNPPLCKGCNRNTINQSKTTRWKYFKLGKRSENAQFRDAQTCDECGARFEQPKFAEPSAALQTHKALHQTVRGELQVGN